mmetsp:Transcript_25843/g.44061  ORF Transcript_25843/g.44061 Transcript_25843/m.44061 type:complete len:225 (+) Transcript_25843:839-1513(+)
MTMKTPPTNAKTRTTRTRTIRTTMRRKRSAVSLPRCCRPRCFCCRKCFFQTTHKLGSFSWSYSCRRRRRHRRRRRRRRHRSSPPPAHPPLSPPLWCPAPPPTKQGPAERGRCLFEWGPAQGGSLRVGGAASSQHPPLRRNRPQPPCCHFRHGDGYHCADQKMPHAFSGRCPRRRRPCPHQRFYRLSCLSRDWNDNDDDDDEAEVGVMAAGCGCPLPWLTEAPTA